MMTNSENK